MAWTAPRTWVVGEVATAAQLNTHLRDNLNAIGPHVRVRKTTTESVTNSTTLQNDDELFFSIAANETWLVRAAVFFTSFLAPDIKFGWSVPAGATGRHGGYLPDRAVTTLSGTVEFASEAALTTAIEGGGAGANELSGMLFASVVNGATAGTVNLQSAQAAATADATSVLAGSFLIAHRIA